MITTVCKISYGSQTVPPIVPAVQGDTGRAISFEIADFTPPAGATATYFILKPSGEAIYNSATITDNSILCELTAQSLAEAGENRMQVRVLQGEDIVTSFEVILMVRTFLGDDAIQSGTEMNIFDQAVAQATEQFQENAEQIVEEVIESIPSDYTALTEEVDELNERLDDEIADVKEDLKQKTGLSEEAKIALLDCFEHVAWIDEHGQTYYDNLHDALYPDTGLDHITAAFAQGSLAVYPSTPLNDLKPYLTVTGYYKDGSTARIEDYALSGTLTVGTSTVTVISEGKTATFNVAVTEDGVQSISAVYNSNELILAVDPISKLRNGLTVTANYTDGTKETVTDYTLSGTLVSGTNNIKVTYRDKETTFNISVPASHYLTSNDIESSYGVNVSIDATGTPTHVSTAEAYFAILFKSNVVKFRTKLTEWLDQSHFTMVVYKNSSSNNVYGIDPGTVSQYVPTERCKLTLKSGNNGYDKESDYTDTIIESFTPVHDWPAVLIPYADTDVVFELTSGKITISDVYGNEICSVNATNANRLGYWGSFYLIGTYFTNIVIIDS